MILVGDVMSMIATIPSNSIDCVVTSPPYWGLRDYGADGQLGLEPTPEMYVGNMRMIFEQVRRVLKNDGTLFLNLGDSYFGGRVQSCDIFGKAKRGSVKSGYASRSPDDVRKDYWWKSIGDTGGRRALEQAHGSLTRIQACMVKQTARVASEDSSDQQQTEQFLNASLGYAQTLIPVFEQLRASLASKPAGFFPPLPGFRTLDDALSAFLSSLNSFAVYGRQSLDKWADYAETPNCKVGIALLFEALERYRQCIEGYYSLFVSWLEQGTKIEPERPVSLLKPKDLCGIPWRVAFALQSDGWYLRQDIIWHKPNPMPESVRDRCTKAHEYIFLLSKSPRYYFDYEAIKEPAKCGWRGSEFHTGKTVGREQKVRPSVAKGGFKAKGEPLPGRLPFRAIREWRNKRSVWSVTSKPFKGAHFATFPPDLIEPCILAGCPPGGTVLDPFFGAGTTGLVAKKHGRNWIGIELK